MLSGLAGLAESAPFTKRGAQPAGDRRRSGRRTDNPDGESAKLVGLPSQIRLSRRCGRRADSVSESARRPSGGRRYEARVHCGHGCGPARRERGPSAVARRRGETGAGAAEDRQGAGPRLHGGRRPEDRAADDGGGAPAATAAEPGAACGDARPDVGRRPATCGGRDRCHQRRQKRRQGRGGLARQACKQARDELARSRRLLTAMEQPSLVGVQSASAQITGQKGPDPSRQQEAARKSSACGRTSRNSPTPCRSSRVTHAPRAFRRAGSVRLSWASGPVRPSLKLGSRCRRQSRSRISR